VCGVEGREEFTAKESGEHPHRKQEIFVGGYPLAVFLVEAAAGDDAVDVGMKSQVARPRVQHDGHAELGAEARRVVAERQQGLAGGSQQQGVHARGVGHREGSECLGKGEHEVEVRGIEDAALAGLDLRLLSRALA
jgi:hypothetical protein